MIPNDLWYESSCQWFLSYIWLWIFLLKKHLNFLLSMVSCCLLHRGNNWVCFKLHLRVYLRDPFPSICSRGNTKVQQESLPWDCLQQRFQSNITRSCMYRATEQLKAPAFEKALKMTFSRWPVSTRSKLYVN